VAWLADEEGGKRRLSAGSFMDLASKYVVIWLSPEAIETFLGVLEPAQARAMTTWTVADRFLGEWHLFTVG
jgi:hypothetical protein